jgi:uncharacterized surface protein with fasciclin (FAS1) repeats
MIALKLNYKKLFVGILTIALVSCSDPWSDRQSNDANLKVSLSVAITNTTETSKFAELLVKTGYDKVLSESKTYTVFAPTNDAMALVDASILNDPAKLTFFVQNHIALTAYSSVRDKASEKIKMLSEKYLVFKGITTIDDATIVTADKYTANGVFHIINKALTPKQNIWQYVNNLSTSSAMSKYLLSLTELNIYKADSIAKINPIPGRYADSLTNCYLRNVYNLNNEKNSYTLFLMDDAGYTTEVDKLKPYLIKNSTARTDTYSSYFTVRDMAFPKAYLPNELPTTLTTRFGVTVPIDKTQIVGDPIILSNGIIYRIKKVDVPLKNRLVTTKIEGESTSWFTPSTARSKIVYRDVKDPFGFLFNDIMVKNSGIANFTLNYSATDVYSTTYSVYWRAVNDLQSTVFQQRLLIGTVIRNNVIFPLEAIKDFGYKDVPVKLYDEVYLGDFTMLQAGNIDMISLVGANSTTNGTNTMSLDYLKFVPVVK